MNELKNTFQSKFEELEKAVAVKYLQIEKKIDDIPKVRWKLIVIGFLLVFLIGLIAGNVL